MKRSKKHKMTPEEIEAQRLAAHEPPQKVDNHPDEIFDPTETLNTDEYIANVKAAEEKTTISWPKYEEGKVWTEEELDKLLPPKQDDKPPHPANDAVDIEPEWKEDEEKDELPDFQRTPEELAAEELGEEEDEEPKPNSVVAEKFKLKYIENAKANGHGGKAAKRSNWDWLSQRIADYCLDEKHHIRMPDFVAILEANGIEEPEKKWPNRNKGWEGRFRMTGRVALQKIVADAQALRMPDGTVLAAPAEFVEKYRTKA